MSTGRRSRGRRPRRWRPRARARAPRPAGQPAARSHGQATRVQSATSATSPPRAPMPMAWSRWRDLPSVCSAGRDHQLRAVELGDVLVAARRHRGAQAAHQVERAVVLARGTADDLLERAVLRRLDAGAARERRVEGRHAPVEAVAGRLVGAGQRRADHHRVRAAGDRLRDVAARAHAAVGDHAARTRRSPACAGSGPRPRRRSPSPAGRRCRARRAWCRPRRGRRRRARPPRRCA